MKKLVFFLSSISIVLLILLQQPHFSLSLTYDTAITTLPISVLKNLRTLSSKEKQQLFQNLHFSTVFSPLQVVQKIKNTFLDAHIILWFTDHLGKIYPSWYQTTFLTSLSSTNTFWLTDLAAWRYLTLKESELSECKDYTIIKQGIKNKSLTRETCPLFYDRSGDLESFSKEHKILHAYSFFTWLYDRIDTIEDFKMSPLGLVRSDKRKESLSYSLRDLGYVPKFLDCFFGSHNLLDLDYTQVFPLLQYLEGLYYAYIIVKECVNQGKNKATLLFVLPNKEFTYYLVPAEQSFFNTFKSNFTELLNPLLINSNFKVHIYFQPFAYGSDFYDMPFEKPLS